MHILTGCGAGADGFHGCQDGGGQAIYGPMHACITPYAAIPKEQEIVMLESQAKWLEQTLEQIRKRLEELQSE